MSYSNNVNRTSIIFNDNLKDIIREIKDEFSSLINNLGNIKVDNPFKAVRKGLDKAFSRFDFGISSKSSFNKPDYFALFMCLINDDLDNVSSWEGVMTKLDIDEGYNHQVMDYTCCCGQHIQHSCIIFLKDKSCVVGNCCVEKNLITNAFTSIAVQEKIKLKLKTIKKKQKEQTEQIKQTQIKKQKEDELSEFKSKYPTKCYECHGFCKEEYDRCYKCKSVKDGKVQCACGSYHDKKYKRCFTCSKSNYQN